VTTKKVVRKLRENSCPSGGWRASFRLAAALLRISVSFYNI